MIMLKNNRKIIEMDKIGCDWIEITWDPLNGSYQLTNCSFVSATKNIPFHLIKHILSQLKDKYNRHNSNFRIFLL